MDWAKPYNLLGFSATAKVWLILSAAALVVALALFGAGTGTGYAWATGKSTEKVTKAQNALSKYKADQLAALNKANEANRNKERAHEQEVAQLRADLAAAEGKEQAVDAQAVADYRSGADRLRLPVRTCSTAVAAAADAASARAHEEASAELAPETSATLYGIAADGDEAIRQLTGLQAWAESAVKLCGLPESTKEP